MKRLIAGVLLVLAACQPRPRYIWYGNETVQELRAQLNAVPAGIPIRLEFRDSIGKKWMHVIPETPLAGRGFQFTPLNKSQVCPPIC